MATCKAVLGQKKYQHCEWITEKSLQLVKIRKKRKAALKSDRTHTERSYQLKRIWRLSVDAQPRRRSITQLDSKEVERMQDQTTYQRKPLRLVQEFRLLSFIFFLHIWETVSVPKEYKERYIVKFTKKGGCLVDVGTIQVKHCCK